MDYKPQQSMAAIASLVLGILSLLFSILTGIPAIIFGIVALVYIGKSGGLLKGKGLAIAGIILAVVSMVMMVFVEIGLLRPSPSQVRTIQQKSQFHSIEVGLDLFKSDLGTYPDSSVSPQMSESENYCGTHKLMEALVGRDLLGFHPDSKFRSNGMDDSGKSLYVPETVKARKGPYLDIENANTFQLKDIFKDVGAFDGSTFVICDVYEKKRVSGKKTGMPVLYFKANTSGKTMDANVPVDQRIYNVQDNINLICMAAVNGSRHPLAEDSGKLFYEKDYIINSNITKITKEARPYRANSYILISAGPDGLYGTSDDIFNFEKNIGD